MITRSAVLRPMPGIRVSIATSSDSMIRTKSSTLAPDRIPRAIFGPTPDTLSNARNRRRSPSEPNPYRMCASSRTTRWVNKATGSPAAGSP